MATKLKKMGIPLTEADSNSVKKQLLLKAYEGPEEELAEDAIRDLLGMQPRRLRCICVQHE
jgi:hypothetical protein